MGGSLGEGLVWGDSWGRFRLGSLVIPIGPTLFGGSPWAPWIIDFVLWIAALCSGCAWALWLLILFCGLWFEDWKLSHRASLQLETLKGVFELTSLGH